MNNTYQPNPNYIMQRGKHKGYPANEVHDMDYLVWYYNHVSKDVFLDKKGNSPLSNEGDESTYIGLTSFNFYPNHELFMFSLEAVQEEV